ncbi:hypothetical protein JCM8097_004346 [Rhodosporidiobolus ruineniae]
MAQNDPPSITTTADPDTALLRSVYPRHLLDPSSPTPTHSDRPFVTLTYAQSLDGKIAGPGGAQIRLSGEESMRLTHWLRELHDSILVGSGTVKNDDPQLTARLPDLLPLPSQPTPIILDSRLSSPPGCKLVTNAQNGVGRRPMFVHGPEADEEARRRLEEAGAELVEGERDPSTNHLSLPALLSPSSPSRPHLGRSLMVEGGASVISSFLASGLVDLVIVTVAPVLIGSEGVSVTRPGLKVPRLEHLETKVYGRDTVFVCRPVYDAAE